MVHVTQTGVGIPPESACEGARMAGAAESGTIRRGIGSALSGMKTLTGTGTPLVYAPCRACAGGKHHRPGGTLLHRLDHAPI